MIRIMLEEMKQQIIEDARKGQEELKEEYSKAEILKWNRCRNMKRKHWKRKF